MGKVLSTIVLASATLLLAGCQASQTKDAGKGGDAEEETSIMTGEGMQYAELAKVPLPCSKEVLYTAWRQIGAVEVSKRKNLDYKEHTPTLFISTDLDKDENPEILMRGEPPFAAVFSFVKDSLYLITFVDNAQIGLGITPDGDIMRSGTGSDGSYVSQFIKLKDSQIASVGECREMFAIRDNEMVSNSTKYLLQRDSAMVEVSKEEYMAEAPGQEGTYFEDIEGWEDFRRP